MTPNNGIEPMAPLSAADPLALFDAWLKSAEGLEPNDPNAVALATVGGDGMPDVRMVLLKGFDARGFVFYTNLESCKGKQLNDNQKASLCFHWKSLRRQVRVEGAVESVSDKEADAYFATRPRDAQIGAWASQQSRPMAGQIELERRIANFSARYAVGAVPRPPHWSGFRVIPRRIEFWEERPFRLHDRLVFLRDGANWRSERLYP